MTKKPRREPHFGPAPTEPGAPPGDGRGPEPRRAGPRGGAPSWAQLGIGAAAVLAVLVGTPMAIEQVGDPCRALEVRAMGLDLGRMVGSDWAGSPVIREMSRAIWAQAASGEVAAASMKDRLPLMPSGVACAAQYWVSWASPATLRMLDPSAIRAASRLHRR